MSLIFTGGFKPLPKVKVTVPPFVPTIPTAPAGWSPYFYNYARVYEGWSGWEGSGSFIVNKPSNNSGNNVASIAYGMNANKTYLEFKVLNTTVSNNNWFGLLDAPFDNGSWNSVSASSSPMAVSLTSNGTVFSKGVSRTTRFPSLKVGDIVGFALSFGAGYTRISIHVNGEWRDTSNRVVPQSSIEDGTRYTESLLGYLALVPVVGASAAMTVEINTGQTYSPYVPAGYRTLRTNSNEVNLLAGPSGTQRSDQTVQLGTLDTARSSRPIPNNLPFYFEVSISSVRSDTRIGFKHYRERGSIRLGGSTVASSEGVRLNNGEFYIYNNPGSYAGVMTGNVTCGIARQGNRMWFRHPTTGWIGNPVTKSGGRTLYTASTHVTYFAVDTDSFTTATLNAGSTPFAYQVPEGFQPWNAIDYTYALS